MKNKLWLPLVLFAAVCGVFGWQLSRNAQGDDPKALESALIGKPVPQAVLADLLENRTHDGSVFRQRQPLLLNVWATWCPTCYAEHQYLNRLAAQGVRIIGLNYKDDSGKAAKWLNDLGNPYQTVLKDEQGKFAFELGVYGAPETFVIGGDGVIHYRYAGDVNEKVWTQTLKPMMDKLKDKLNGAAP